MDLGVFFFQRANVEVQDISRSSRLCFLGLQIAEGLTSHMVPGTALDMI